MGRRKRINAEKRKELKKHIVFSSLRNIRISCRKIRIVADLIRNMDVVKALSVLKYNNRRNISIILSKILLSTISNWKNKNKNSDLSNLYIKEIKVDRARILKRIQPAPQGRGHRIKKYSTHINITLQKYLWDIK
ncbi:50S ribosomal protein L22 [Candidatus Uzinura diaspidicola str. ASNER]|uniref:50S ribosomal protein L22 n=1 Tax=Candidatus Uzinura diaspidicola str. ASNER TaxID=1133592 RepID=L7VJM4_9FLAO|nr:50S ribosomal protein L22 [Candidatus Uzinura diaspidicola str. ASNER]